MQQQPGAMAQEQQPLPYGQSFRSSFGPLTSSMSPHALSFTNRSVVGTLDAENPFGTMGASFHGATSFRMPPPDAALAAELYRTIPMAASSSPVSPLAQGSPGTTLFDTATGPAGVMSPLGTATGPAGILSPMGTMTIPVVPTADPFQLSQGVATANFGAAPGMVMVPPTAPTFASMPVIGQAAPLTMPTMSMPAVVPATSSAPTFASMSVIGQAAPWTMPTTSMPAVVPATSSVTSQYTVGTQVEYLSDETGTWVKAVVQGFNESTGQYILDLGVKAPAHQLRPASLFVPVPTPPGSGVVTVAAAPQEASWLLPPAPPSVAPVTIAAQPAYYTVTQPATQMATIVQSMPPTNLTTSITANPFASAAVIAGQSQSLSSVSVSEVVGAPVFEAGALPIPAQPSNVVVRQIGTTLGPPVVAAADVPASPVATLPAVATPVSTTLLPGEPVLDPARVVVASSSVSVPVASLAAAPVAAPSASPMVVSSVAQGDMYTVPPEDVWFPVGQPGQPAVRVEPNWREGQWWYTTAVDFKGLERCPMGSKQDSLVLADESLLQMEENGEIPPLPAPKSWSETDTCPIT